MAVALRATEDRNARERVLWAARTDVADRGWQPISTMITVAALHTWPSSFGATEDRNNMYSSTDSSETVVAVALRRDRGSQRQGAQPFSHPVLTGSPDLLSLIPHLWDVGLRTYAARLSQPGAPLTTVS